MFKKLLLAGSFGITAIMGAQAADVEQPASAGYFYLGVDGGYVFKDEGSGIDPGNPVIGDEEATPGDGYWISGYAGYVTDSSWDFRIGVGYADLAQGDIIGPPPFDEFAVDDAQMLSVDGDVGYLMDVGENSTFRPFVGIRYLRWDQDQGYHPDEPPGCCFVDSEFEGVGPRLGFDASFAVFDPVRIVAGADASILFGDIDFDAGSAYVNSSGSDSRTAFTVGGYLGFDLALTETVTLGAKYRVLYLDGTSFDDANLVPFPSDDPSGTARNLLHGPAGSLSIRF